MDANEVHQVLLDTIGDAATKVGVGTSTGEALLNLTQAWVLLTAKDPDARMRMLR